MFTQFFARTDTFSVGICNGCQMMAQLRDIIPGASRWPHFGRNLSSRYEARLCMVEVQDSPSLFFAGMAGSKIPSSQRTEKATSAPLPTASRCATLIRMAA